VYFFIPETNGKTLEEIDYIFATGEAKLRLEKRFADAANQQAAMGLVTDESIYQAENGKQDQTEAKIENVSTV